MDVTCLNCGASNRNTSRFCARCGEPLPVGAAAEEKSRGGLSLPWLRGVQERATKQTGGLDPRKVDDVEAQRAAQEAAQLSAVTQPASAVAGVPIDEAPETGQAAAQEATTLPDGDADAQPEPVAGSALQESIPASGEGAAPEQVSQEEATAPLESAPGGGTPDEPAPEWVVGILEPESAQPPRPEEAYEPEEMEHIMPWLAGPPEGEGEAPPGQQGGPGMPPWLSDVTVQETLQSRAASGEAKTADVTELDLEGVEPFVPPDVAERRAAEPAAAPVPRSRHEKVPEWLKTIAPTPEEEQAEEEIKLDGDERSTRVTLTPSDTLAQPLVREVPVRPPRPGAVETLAALIQPGAAMELTRAVPGAIPERAAGEATTRRGGLRHWLFPDGIIYIAVLALLLTVLVLRPPMGSLTSPAATDVLEFYDAIEDVPQTMPALVVYDWDASRSAEMAALSQAVTHHLMARRIPFVTISTVPQGPGFAQMVTADAAADPDARYGYEYGRDYLVLGYLPGNEAGLSALMQNFSTVLPLDYVRSQGLETHEIVRGRQLNSIDDFALIVHLVSDEAALRNWIEQIAARTRVPVVAAVPQGMEPVARPYRGIAGPGLKAVVSGQAGALQYARQLSQGRSATRLYSAGHLSDKLNAQSVAQVMVALVILAAFVSLGVRRTR